MLIHLLLHSEASSTHHKLRYSQKSRLTTDILSVDLQPLEVEVSTRKCRWVVVDKVYKEQKVNAGDQTRTKDAGAHRHSWKDIQRNRIQHQPNHHRKSLKDSECEISLAIADLGPGKFTYS